MQFVVILLAANTGLALASGHFWAIADIHISDDYVVGSSPPTFCTSGKGGAGKFGAFNCDGPHESLLVSAVDFMRSARPATGTFALWLGDSATLYSEHPLGVEDEQVIAADVEAVAAELSRGLEAAGTRVLPVLGNHDSHPATGPAPPGVPAGAAFLAWLADLWSRYFSLGPEALETVRAGGYYTVLVEPGVRVVALNTMYWARMNPWAVNESEEDLGGQWAWLRNVLASARQAGERAIVAGHIPPGIDVLNDHGTWVESAEKAWALLSEEFADVISITLFGHLHRDSFSLVRKGATASGSAVGVAVHVPSLTPRCATTPPESGQTEGKHPSVRLFEYESGSQKLQITDWVQYWANLTDGNDRGGLLWIPAYSARFEYGFDTFDTAEFVQVAQMMHKSSSTWCSFERHWFVERGWPQCDARCRAKALCSFETASLDAYTECSTTAEPLTFVC